MADWVPLFGVPLPFSSSAKDESPTEQVETLILIEYCTF
jgi:hypothetical protein